MSTPLTATEATKQRIATSAERLPMHDTQDFDDAERGLIGRTSIRQITADDGRVVWISMLMPSSMVRCPTRRTRACGARVNS